MPGRAALVVAAAAVAAAALAIAPGATSAAGAFSPARTAGPAGDPTGDPTAGPTPDPSAPTAALSEPLPLGPGAWCWFADPRAVFHQGRHRRTYVGWIDGRGNVVVASVDHDTRAVRRAVIHRRLGVDDHNNPALHVRPDGRIEAYFSAHNGGRLFIRRTRRPEDITAWGPRTALPGNTPGRLGFTYPNVLRLAGERRTYLLWRGGDWHPAFATRSDGRGWSAPRRLISAPGRRPYVKVAPDGRRTIHIAFSDGHPGEGSSRIRYVRYRGGRLETATGTVLHRLARGPLRYTRAELVDPAAGGRVRSWIHDMAIGADGRPVIVFAQFAGLGDHRYRYARFDGGRWVVSDITPAGGSIDRTGGNLDYSGGIALDQSDPRIVYLSAQRGAVHELERWTTPDGGRTWSAEPLTAGSPEPHFRPVSPRGHPPGELPVLWLTGRYDGWRRYDTMVLGALR